MGNQKICATAVKNLHSMMDVVETITLNDVYRELGLDPLENGDLILWEKVNGEWRFVKD